MIFIRRDGRVSARLIVLRVGLFFLAAGLWLAGVAVGNDLVTAAAIVVAAVALLVGLAVRRMAAKEEEEEEEEEGEEVEEDVRDPGT